MFYYVCMCFSMYEGLTSVIRTATTAVSMMSMVAVVAVMTVVVMMMAGRRRGTEAA